MKSDEEIFDLCQFIRSGKLQDQPIGLKSEDFKLLYEALVT
jgi:hypothetical protein